MIIKKSLAEIQLILEEKESKLNDLFRERNNSIYNIYKIEEGKKNLVVEDSPERHVGVIMDDIARIQLQIRKLREARHSGNLTATIEFKDELENNMTLQEGIIYIKQLRLDLNNIKMLSQYKPKREVVNPNKFSSNDDGKWTYEKVSEPTYNITNMRDLAVKNEKLITKLELEIGKANHINCVDIDEAFIL